MTQTATTRLEAVNIMLSTLGESPVNTLAGNANATTAMAQIVLDETDKETQIEGWKFNQEADVVLTPTAGNEIIIPSNAIRVDVRPETYPGKDYVVIGTKLYERVAHSFTITSQVKVDVVYLRTFDELPEPARAYIITRAARKFQDRMLGAQEHHSYNMRDEAQARARLENYESAQGHYTIFDNSGTARIIDRRYPNRGAF